MPAVKVEAERLVHKEPWNERNMSSAVNPLVLSQVTIEEFSKVVFFVEVTKSDLEDALAQVAQGVSRSITLILKRNVFAMRAPHTRDLTRVPFDELKAATSIEEVERILMATGIQKLGD